MSLGLSSSGSKPACPFQQGTASGTKNGTPVQVNVDYLIDTGADCATVRATVGSRFDVKTTGFSASPTTGGAGIQVVTGIATHFTVEDAGGHSHQVTSSRYVGIKSTNSGSDLLGMAQIADVQAEVRWDPNAKSGSLRIGFRAGASDLSDEDELEEEKEHSEAMKAEAQRHARVVERQRGMKEHAPRIKLRPPGSG